MRHRPTPLHEERELPPGELPFSITDRLGVIRYGNEPFCRISAYSPDELFDEPHSLVRHPDMPRAIFRLMWTGIQRGDTVAAYVKNLAADGRYYWVLVVVAPCEDRYLSVHLKPTAGFLQTVTPLYAYMLGLERRLEAEKGLRDAVSASVAQLQARLPDLGFADDRAFMQHALPAEVISRQRLLDESGTAVPRGAIVEPGLTRLRTHAAGLDTDLRRLFDHLDELKGMHDTLAQRARGVLDTAQRLQRLAGSISRITHNLGDRGETLRIVVCSLDTGSAGMEAGIGSLIDRAADVVALLDHAIFDIATSRLQSEVGLQLADELIGDHVEPSMRQAESLDLLLGQITARTTSVFTDLRRSESCVHALAQHLQVVLRLSKTLHFVQLTGQKEIASGAAFQAFGELFAQAQDLVDSTQDDCRSLDLAVKEIRHHLGRTRALEVLLQPHLEVLGAQSQEPEELLAG